MDMANHPLLSVDDSLPPFAAAYPQLQRLDRSVLCQICKELFAGPVSIACGHSFCSHCIRSYLDVDPKEKRCPTCREAVSEGSIRRNRALEEITDSWEDSRPTLITLTTQPVAGPSRRRLPPEQHSKPSSTSSILKRARDGSHSRSRSPSKVRRLDNSVTDMLDPEGNEFTYEDDLGDDIVELTENDESSCPLCEALMPIAAIPMHIERGCPPPKAKTGKANGSGNQKSDWRKVFAGVGMAKEKDVELKRIIKPNYSLTKDLELRSLLMQYSLPANGDHDTLVNRFQQWILLFNSNLDTSHPKSQSALRAKLTEMETAKKRDKERGKDDAVKTLGTKAGMAKYASEQKADFERLRQDIIQRDRRRKDEDMGKGTDTAIEVD